MKEETIAFYKAVFKHWMKKSVAPFIVALILQAIIGYVYSAKNWDSGKAALHILIWEYTKRCFEESGI